MNAESNYDMDKIIENRFYEFYYRLPDTPIMLESGNPDYAEYDPFRDVILIPKEAEEDPAYYFNFVLHEYGHKKLILYLQENRPIEKISYNDFIAFSEMVAEGVSLCVCKELGFYDLTADNQVTYMKAFKILLEDKTLLSKVFPAIKRITSVALKREVLQDDLPTDVCILLGLFQSH